MTPPPSRGAPGHLPGLGRLHRRKSEQSARYTVTAVVRFWENETRHPLGSAPSRRKARRIGYLDGCRHYPLLSTVALFELEIVDTLTGERVRAHGAEVEAYHRARALPTVADVGWW